MNEQHVLHTTSWDQSNSTTTNRQHSRSLEQLRRHLVQVMAPYRPLVTPVSQPEGVRNAAPRQHLVERPVSGAGQRVVLPDARPEEFEVLVCRSRIAEE